MATQDHTHIARPNASHRGDRRRFNGRTPRGLTVEQRFWSKVDKGHPDGCWQWTAGVRPVSGYGDFFVSGGAYTHAHRWAYESAVGPVPSGMELDHLCRNRLCVNPAHLEAVPPATNVRRGRSPGALALRRERCDLGHEFSQYGAERLGRRICRLCRSVYNRAYRDGYRGTLTTETFQQYYEDSDAEKFAGAYTPAPTERNDGCPDCLTRDNVPVSVEHHWPNESGYRARYVCGACEHSWWTGWAYEYAEVPG